MSGDLATTEDDTSSSSTVGVVSLFESSSITNSRLSKVEKSNSESIANVLMLDLQLQKGSDLSTTQTNHSSSTSSTIFDLSSITDLKTAKEEKTYSESIANELITNLELQGNRDQKLSTVENSNCSTVTSSTSTRISDSSLITDTSLALSDSSLTDDLKICQNISVTSESITNALITNSELQLGNYRESTQQKSSADLISSLSSTESSPLNTAESKSMKSDELNNELIANLLIVNSEFHSTIEPITSGMSSSRSSTPASTTSFSTSASTASFSTSSSSFITDSKSNKKEESSSESIANTLIKDSKLKTSYDNSVIEGDSSSSNSFYESSTNTTSNSSSMRVSKSNYKDELSCQSVANALTADSVLQRSSEVDISTSETVIGSSTSQRSDSIEASYLKELNDKSIENVLITNSKYQKTNDKTSHGLNTLSSSSETESTLTDSLSTTDSKTSKRKESNSDSIANVIIISSKLHTEKNESTTEIENSNVAATSPSLSSSLARDLKRFKNEIMNDELMEDELITNLESKTSDDDGELDPYYSNTVPSSSLSSLSSSKSVKSEGSNSEAIANLLMTDLKLHNSNNMSLIETITSDSSITKESTSSIMYKSISITNPYTNEKEELNNELITNEWMTNLHLQNIKTNMSTLEVDSSSSSTVTSSTSPTMSDASSITDSKNSEREKSKSESIANVVPNNSKLQRSSDISTTEVDSSSSITFTDTSSITMSNSSLLSDSKTIYKDGLSSESLANDLIINSKLQRNSCLTSYSSTPSKLSKIEGQESESIANTLIQNFGLRDDREQVLAEVDSLSSSTESELLSAKVLHSSSITGMKTNRTVSSSESIANELITNSGLQANINQKLISVDTSSCGTLTLSSSPTLCDFSHITSPIISENNGEISKTILNVLNTNSEFDGSSSQSSISSTQSSALPSSLLDDNMSNESVVNILMTGSGLTSSEDESSSTITSSQSSKLTSSLIKNHFQSRSSESEEEKKVIVSSNTPIDIDPHTINNIKLRSNTLIDSLAVTVPKSIDNLEIKSSTNTLITDSDRKIRSNQGITKHDIADSSSEIDPLSSSSKNSNSKQNLIFYSKSNNEESIIAVGYSNLDKNEINNTSIKNYLTDKPLTKTLASNESIIVPDDGNYNSAYYNVKCHEDIEEGSDTVDSDSSSEESDDGSTDNESSSMDESSSYSESEEDITVSSIGETNASGTIKYMSTGNYSELETQGIVNIKKVHIENDEKNLIKTKETKESHDMNILDHKGETNIKSNKDDNSIDSKLTDDVLVSLHSQEGKLSYNEISVEIDATHGINITNQQQDHLKINYSLLDIASVDSDESSSSSNSSYDSSSDESDDESFNTSSSTNGSTKSLVSCGDEAISSNEIINGDYLKKKIIYQQGNDEIVRIPDQELVEYSGEINNSKGSITEAKILKDIVFQDTKEDEFIYVKVCRIDECHELNSHSESCADKKKYVTSTLREETESIPVIITKDSRDDEVTKAMIEESNIQIRNTVENDNTENSASNKSVKYLQMNTESILSESSSESSSSSSLDDDESSSTLTVSDSVENISYQPNSITENSELEETLSNYSSSTSDSSSSSSSGSYESEDEREKNKLSRRRRADIGSSSAYDSGLCFSDHNTPRSSFKNSQRRNTKKSVHETNCVYDIKYDAPVSERSFLNNLTRIVRSKRSRRKIGVENKTYKEFLPPKRVEETPRKRHKIGFFSSSSSSRVTSISSLTTTEDDESKISNTSKKRTKQKRNIFYL
nr:serine-rich adhesin for platelets-like [Lepeophtheirus salmonis]